MTTLMLPGVRRKVPVHDCAFVTVVFTFVDVFRWRNRNESEHRHEHENKQAEPQHQRHRKRVGSIEQLKSLPNLALPLAVRSAVERFHGFHCCIAVFCLACLPTTRASLRPDSNWPALGHHMTPSGKTSRPFGKVPNTTTAGSSPAVVTAHPHALARCCSDTCPASPRRPSASRAAGRSPASAHRPTPSSAVPEGYTASTPE